MTEPNIEIVTVKRAHRWIVKRGSNEMTCQNCGMAKRQSASLVCFEEEVEREVEPPNA